MVFLIKNPNILLRFKAIDIDNLMVLANILDWSHIHSKTSGGGDAMSPNDEHELNSHIFKAKSMQELYSRMGAWRKIRRRTFLFISIEQNGDMFRAIALTDPSEVVNTSMDGNSHADVTELK